MIEAYALEAQKSTTLSRHKRILRGSVALSALVMALSFAGVAQAQENWNGGDGNWNDAGKWSTGAVPTGVFDTNNPVPTPTVIGTGAAGTVTVNTNNAVARNIQVGNGSTLQILAGGVLNTLPAVKSNSINTIGFSALGGTGTMLIDGGTWNAGTAGVRVGNGAIGILTVKNSGKLNMTEGLLSVGLNANGNGTLNIDNGSVTNSNGALRLGYNGATGTLKITNGGTLATNGAFENSVGKTDADGPNPGTGIVEISGENSAWTVGPTAALAIGTGVGADGTVTVSDGGKLSFKAATQFHVGYSGGTGKLTVTGENSLVESAGGLTIANTAGSTGTLLVDDKARVTLGAGSLVVGREAGSTATVTIANGAAIIGADHVGIGEAGAAGTLTVEGNGSLLTSEEGVTVGTDTGSTGELNVRDGATVKAKTVVVGAANGTGTLNIGNGAKAGIIDANVKMSGASSTINFNHNETNYVFSKTIKNGGLADADTTAPLAGSVNFIGSGTTTLTAANTYTSATNVNDGELYIAAGASIANSSLTTVNNGAKLSGGGALGNVSMKSGATIAPSGSGTLTTKDITFEQGSTYAVSINPAGQHGKIAAANATLNGGDVKVTAAGGDYRHGSRFTILTTTGNLTGKFDSLDSDFAFLDATLGLDYAGKKVDLALTRNSATFESVAKTANQKSVARAIDGLFASNEMYGNILSQSADGARTAYDALSGEAHASNQAALINVALLVSDTIGSHLSRPLPTGSSYWAQGFGNWADWSSDANAAKLETTTGGFLSGIDLAYGPWRVGAAAGYSQTNADVTRRLSSLETDSFHFSTYGAWNQGPFGVQFGGAYSWNDTTSERSVKFPGFAQYARGDYDAGTTQVFGEANYRFTTGPATFQPFAGVTFINHGIDGFKETGGIASLTLLENDHNVTFTTVGIRPSIMLGQSAGYTFTGRGTAAWRHAFGDVDTSILATLAGSSPFSVAGTPIAEDSLLMEAGLDLAFSPSTTVGLSWAGQYGDEATDNQVKGEFVYRW